MADYIEPRTDAELTIVVEQPEGTPKDDATCTADVYNPRGHKVATGEVLVGVGGGTGQYRLRIDASWSEVSGKALEGEYVAEVTILRAGAQRVRRFRYPVRFDDDD